LTLLCFAFVIRDDLIIPQPFSALSGQGYLEVLSNAMAMKVTALKAAIRARALSNYAMKAFLAKEAEFQQQQKSKRLSSGRFDALLVEDELADDMDIDLPCATAGTQYWDPCKPPFKKKFKTATKACENSVISELPAEDISEPPAPEMACEDSVISEVPAEDLSEPPAPEMACENDNASEPLAPQRACEESISLSQAYCDAADDEILDSLPLVWDRLTVFAGSSSLWTDKFADGARPWTYSCWAKGPLLRQNPWDATVSDSDLDSVEAGGKRGDAYDLRSKAPPAGRLKHKNVSDESALAAGERERWFQSVTNSIAQGGSYGRVLSSVTAELHWRAVKNMAFFLKPDEPVKVEELLTLANLTAFLGHWERCKSARGEHYHPKTIALISRSIGCLAVVFLGKRALREGETRKQCLRKLRTFQKSRKELTKSVMNKLAMAGGGLPARVEDILPPKSLQDALACREKYCIGTQKLSDRIKKLQVELGDEACEKLTYMKFRLARRKAGILATDFLLYTNERLETIRKLVYGRQIKTLDAGNTVYAPLGVNPDKRSTRQRQAREHFVMRKTLSQAFGLRLKSYINHHLPVLREYYGHVDELNPPLHAGEDSFQLFGMFKVDVFRRTVVLPVTKQNSNDLRAHMECTLKAAGTIPKELVQHHVGHGEKTSLRHYQIQGRDDLDVALNQILPGI